MWWGGVRARVGFGDCGVRGVWFLLRVRRSRGARRKLGPVPAGKNWYSMAALSLTDARIECAATVAGGASDAVTDQIPVQSLF